MSARSAADAAREWGLIGTWATDCSAKPSRSNYFLSYYVAPRARLVHKRDWGDGRDENVITEISLRPDGTLELKFDLKSLSPREKRRVIFRKLAEDKYQAMENQLVNTAFFSVKDGKVVATGNPTPVQTRCR